MIAIGYVHANTVLMCYFNCDCVYNLLLYKLFVSYNCYLVITCVFFNLQLMFKQLGQQLQQLEALQRLLLNKIFMEVSGTICTCSLCVRMMYYLYVRNNINICIFDYLFTEQLAAIPEFSTLGPLFKSSSLPVELTEADTEYNVRCIKHMFSHHVVFQVC